MAVPTAERACVKARCPGQNDVSHLFLSYKHMREHLQAWHTHKLLKVLGNLSFDS